MNKDFNSYDKGRHLSLVFIFAIGFGVSILLGWMAFPELLYSKHPQPIDFNHKLHVKISDAGCESCHAFRADGSFSGIPDIANCSGCHTKVENGGADEERLIHEYVEPGYNIPWHVYARQPDSVFFSHVAHVKTAGLACDSCHGDIGQSTQLKIYQKNILTGYSRDIWGRRTIGEGMRMDNCKECHQKMKYEGGSVQTEKDGCFVCHK